MPAHTINARNCTEYLRSIGVEISEETATAWGKQEKEERRRRRAHKAELKRSCEHSRTHDTTVYSSVGVFVDTYCSDCRRRIASTLAPRGPDGGGGEPIPLPLVA